MREIKAPVKKATYKPSTIFGNPNVPYNSIQETLSGGVHSILYWLKKDDPLGPPPTNPDDDPQFSHWEYGVRLWATQNGYQ